MEIRRIAAAGITLALSLAAVASGGAQDSRGRKYKAPPETSRIEVLVLKDSTAKPVANAAVVFHAVKDGRDEGNLQVKTNEEGKAMIDVIATGSNVEVQVIADGFATFANTYFVAETNRSIEIRMLKPRAQISTYQENHGQSSDRAAGVQEAHKSPAKATPPPAAPPAGMPQGASDVKPPQL